MVSDSEDFVLSAKKKKRAGVISLEDFEFNPVNLDLKWSKDMITVLDGYRIHRCFDLTFIEKAVGAGELPKSFVNQWKVIRTVLHKFAAIAPSVPGVEKLLFRRQVISFLSLILITVALPLTMFGFVLRIEAVQAIIFPLAIIVLFVASTSWMISNYYNRKVAWAISNYLEENSQLLERECKHLKKWVQALIWHTSRQIRKDSKEIEKELIKFYNDDYEGIIVLKEPSRLRKHYTVILGASGDSLI